MMGIPIRPSADHHSPPISQDVGNAEPRGRRGEISSLVNPNGKRRVLIPVREIVTCIAPSIRYQMRYTNSRRSSYDATRHADSRATSDGGRDNREAKTLLTAMAAGGIGGGMQKWQMNTHYGAMPQLAVDLNLPLVIINDAVHSG